MCGIVAMFSLGRAIRREHLAAAVSSIHHRGPDGEGIWLSDDEKVGLGHRRLSIIDLETGAQPIFDDSGRVIVVNGELYDFEPIRDRLRQDGYRFRTDSDSEIALHLFAEHGSGCFPHLRGEFAFALFDPELKVLFAARDRFGIKPLFYAVHDGVLYLASEIKALFAAGVPARWDLESYWDRGFLLRDRTLYAGVHQVPAGHCLIATENGIRLERYWDFSYPAAGGGPADQSQEEKVAELRHLLEEAVRLRLRADVPVGVYLSGGLDSCTVLGLAARLHNAPVDAFTLSFEDIPAGDPVFDEADIAREMAQHTGSHMHLLRVSQRDLADSFGDAVRHGETICINAHGAAKFLLSRMVRDHGYKVVLTGEGADEIFGGYAPFRQDMLRHNSEGQDPETLSRLLAMLEDSNAVSSIVMAEDDPESTGWLRRTLGFEPAHLAALRPWMTQLSKLTRDSFGEMRYQTMIDRWLMHLGHPGHLAAIEPVHASMYLWSKSMLVSYILVNLGDRMEMAHSIEGRVPFLDHHLVDRVTQWPVHTKIKGITEKHILREAVRDVLTDTVYRRQKHPFTSPPSTAETDGALFTLAQDTLHSRAMADQPFYDPTKVGNFLNKLKGLPPGPRLGADALVMEILSLATLQDCFSPSA